MNEEKTPDTDMKCCLRVKQNVLLFLTALVMSFVYEVAMKGKNLGGWDGSILLVLARFYVTLIFVLLLVFWNRCRDGQTLFWGGRFAHLERKRAPSDYIRLHYRHGVVALCVLALETVTMTPATSHLAAGVVPAPRPLGRNRRHGS